MKKRRKEDADNEEIEKKTRIDDPEYNNMLRIQEQCTRRLEQAKELHQPNVKQIESQVENIALLVTQYLSRKITVPSLSPETPNPSHSSVPTAASPGASTSSHCCSQPVHSSTNSS